ncbi:MAG: hypothetical protein WEB56_08455 [Roseovarius sp.]
MDAGALPAAGFDVSLLGMLVAAVGVAVDAVPALPSSDASEAGVVDCTPVEVAPSAFGEAGGVDDAGLPDVDVSAADFAADVFDLVDFAAVDLVVVDLAAVDLAALDLAPRLGALAFVALGLLLSVAPAP